MRNHRLFSTIPSVQSLNALVDNFGRKHSYLRISLTEKCNLRCIYCMPEHGVPLTANDRLMTTEERKKAISLFSKLGVNKIRFTGGEPTVSNQLSELIAYTKQHVPTIGMTSNGILLSDRLRGLVQAGLSSVNISLDTLQEDKFGRITRRDGKLLRRVFSSIYKAVSLGLPVKVNCVVIRGLNDEEIADFARLTQELPVDCRFIEIMPFDGNEWNPQRFVSYREIIQRLLDQGIELNKVNQLDRHDTTKWYRMNSTAMGRIGFISSMSSNFCGGCNRLRLTADGKLKVCLFGDDETDLLKPIREESSDDELAQIILQAVQRKKAALGGHPDLTDLAAARNRPMILIGG
eukprot:gene1296-1416_t